MCSAAFHQPSPSPLLMWGLLSTASLAKQQASIYDAKIWLEGFHPGCVFCRVLSFGPRSQQREVFTVQVHIVLTMCMSSTEL